MMLVGCIGLLAAVADLLPETAEAVMRSLRGAGGAAPWEVGAG